MTVWCHGIRHDFSKTMSTNNLLEELDKEWWSRASAQLSLLKQYTDQILEQLDREQIDEAINWGDLHCKETALVIGETFVRYHILIEEAAPNCYKLQETIRETLTKQGWYEIDIEIETEW